MNSTTKNKKPVTINMSCLTTEKQDITTKTVQHFLNRAEAPEFQTLRVLSYSDSKNWAYDMEIFGKL